LFPEYAGNIISRLVAGVAARSKLSVDLVKVAARGAATTF